MEQENKPANVLNIPTAILIAGAIVAASVIYTKAPSRNTAANVDNTANAVDQIQLKPVTVDDHILGNPKAKIKIVEYSDPSCPFCKIFHTSMRKIINDYGATGNVAWVYRSYPLDKPDANGRILHPNAGHESQALECAADLGGNEKFWKYTNRLYEITPSVTGDTPNGLDQKELPNIAKYAGLNVEDFNNCLSSGKFKTKVNTQFTDGVNIGIQGTPTSIIVIDKPFPASVKEQLMNLYTPYRDEQTGEYPIRLSSDSRMIMIGGAMPIETMKATIDLLFTY